MLPKRSWLVLFATAVVVAGSSGCTRPGENTQAAVRGGALDPGWTPHAFDSFMEAWYTASAGVSTDSSGRVNGWADQSVHHRDLNQPVAGGGPTHGANAQGVQTLTFNGAQLLRNDAWSATPAGTESEITILAVIRSAAPQDSAVAGFWDPNGQGYFWAGLRKSGQLALLETWRVFSNSPGQQYVGGQDLGTAVPHVVAWRYQPATGVMTQVIDGISTSSAPIPAIGPLPAMPFVVGAKSLLPTGLFQGDLSELLVLSHALADTDIQSYTDYARSKWNLTAPALTGGPCLDASNMPTPPTTRCDDGNPQTFGDHCAQGACVGTVPASGNPGALSPLAWYHANPQEVVSGDSDQTVSTWFDRSPNHRDLLQAFYYGRPKLGSWPGGKPALHFGGNAGLRRDGWSSAPTGSDQAFTVLAVVQAGSTTQNGAVASWWSDHGYDQVSCSVKSSNGDVAPDLMRADDAGTRQEFTDQVPLGTSPHAIVWRYTPESVTVTVDGQSVPSSGLAPIGPIGPETFLVGMANFLPTGLFIGDIAELAVVPRSITDDEVVAFDGYAASEWGGCVGMPSGITCGAAGSGAVCQTGVCVTPTCSDGADGTRTLTATADFGAGPVTLTVTSTLPTDSTTPLTTATVTINGQTVQAEQVSGPDDAGLTHVTIGYGTGFHGISELDAVGDGTSVTETVDGRQLQPFPGGDAQTLEQNPPALTFVDGQPGPTITIDAGVLQAIAAITSRAGAAADVCGMTEAFESMPLLQASLLPTVLGHTDNAQAFPACKSCQKSCKDIQVACIYSASLACGGAGAALAAIPFLGLGVAAACELTADAACNAASSSCKRSCNNIGSDCCPQACGNGCCDRSETCLNTGTSLCCDAGYTACPGQFQSCVDLTQDVCLGSGQGCGIGVPTCGTGAQEICCPSGLCNGNDCLPSGSLSMTVAATETLEGLTTCLKGVGFTPGATVQLTYLGIPVKGDVVTKTKVIVDGSGSFSLTDHSQDSGGVNCTVDEGSGPDVTLSVTDGSPASTVGTGHVVTATLPAIKWCLNFPSATNTNGGCQ
jgi:hypothetical protein